MAAAVMGAVFVAGVLAALSGSWVAYAILGVQLSALLGLCVWDYSRGRA